MTAHQGGSTLQPDVPRLQRSLELFVRVTGAELGPARGNGTGDVSPVQFALLRYLRWHPGSTFAQLASQFGVSRSAMSQNVERLVTKGLISRAQHPADRRNALLRLTARGEQVVHDTVDGSYQRLNAVLDRMDPADREALEKGVDAFIISALQDLEAVQRACLGCTGDADERCPVSVAHVRLTGRPAAEACSVMPNPGRSRKVVTRARLRESGYH